MLHYDSASGIFTWLVGGRPNCKIGGRAGSVQNTKYRAISINCQSYLEHRLAWLYVHGEWPKHTIDHINGDRADNRLDNLRAATRSQNQHNRAKDKRNTSGHKGVHWSSQHQKWRARICVNRKTKCLGVFDDVQAAAQAYRRAAAMYHAEYARVE